MAEIFTGIVELAFSSPDHRVVAYTPRIIDVENRGKRDARVNSTCVKVGFEIIVLRRKL